MLDVAKLTGEEAALLHRALDREAFSCRRDSEFYAREGYPKLAHRYQTEGVLAVTMRAALLARLGLP